VSVKRGSWKASAQPYGLYVRGKLVVGGTLAPVFNFSLYINAFRDE
jgi:hypothetical protein